MKNLQIIILGGVSDDSIESKNEEKKEAPTSQITEKVEKLKKEQKLLKVDVAQIPLNSAATNLIYNMVTTPAGDTNTMRIIIEVYLQMTKEWLIQNLKT